MCECLCYQRRGMCFKGPFLSKLIYSLNKTKACLCALKCVKVKDNNIQKSWEWKQTAGEDSLRNFRKQRGLSLRKVESRSLTRIMDFDPHISKLFFNNMKMLYNRPEVSLEMIWNLYETGVNTADIFYVHLISVYCKIA